MNPGRAFLALLCTLALAGAGCVAVDPSRQTLTVNLEWNYGPALRETAKIIAESLAAKPAPAAETVPEEQPAAEL